MVTMDQTVHSLQAETAPGPKYMSFGQDYAADVSISIFIS